MERSRHLNKHVYMLVHLSQCRLATKVVLVLFIVQDRLRGTPPPVSVKGIYTRTSKTQMLNKKPQPPCRSPKMTSVNQNRRDGRFGSRTDRCNAIFRAPVIKNFTQLSAKHLTVTVAVAVIIVAVVLKVVLQTLRLNASHQTNTAVKVCPLRRHRELAPQRPQRKKATEAEGASRTNKQPGARGANKKYLKSPHVRSTQRRPPSRGTASRRTSRPCTPLRPSCARRQRVAARTAWSCRRGDLRKNGAATRAFRGRQRPKPDGERTC